MKDIKLTRAAAEKREKAQAKLDALKERVQNQLKGVVPEGETKLSAEEIAEKTQEIQDMIAEAKSAESLDSLEGLAARSDDAADGAKEILARGAMGGTEDRKDPFGGLAGFLRSVRASAGNYESDLRLTKGQKGALSKLRSAATKLAKGEPIAAAEIEFDSKALVGDDATSDGRGDYLVPTVYMSELLKVMAENQAFVNRARQVPFPRPTIALPRLAQNTVADTRPVFSFAAVTKKGEAAQVDEREPTFEQFSVSAYKYAAYTEASDELLEDSITPVPPLITSLLTEAISYEYDRDSMRGSGSDEPTGWLGHASEYAVNRQTASQVGTTDIFNMEARFFGSGGIYLFHPSVIPQLYALNASNIIVWNGDLTTAAPGSLLGRPLIRTFKLPALGTKGDIALVDPSFYIAGNMGGMTVKTSPHYKFRNDVMAWLATFRAAGCPWPSGNFSMEGTGAALTYAVSPFVPLDVVSAS